MALAGTDSKGRTRGVSVNDEKSLTGQFPFLVTSTGEAAITAGNRGVANLENREQRDMGKFTGGAAAAPSQTTPALALAAAAGTTSNDPNATRDEEQT